MKRCLLVLLLLVSMATVCGAQVPWQHGYPSTNYSTATLRNIVRRDHPLNQGMLAWYQELPTFNRSGTVWRNVIPGKPHATFSGLAVPGTSTSGRNPTARSAGAGEIRCDGTNDTITSDVTFSAPPYPLTLSIWIKPTTNTGVLAALMYGSTDNEQGILIVNDNLWAMSQGATNVQATTAAPTAGAWYMATGVFAAVNSRKIYINGVLKATETTNENVVPAAKIRICNRFSADQLFSGAVDGAQIWGRALSDEEVRRLYIEELSRNTNRLSVIMNDGFVTAAPPPSGHPGAFFPFFQ